MLLLKKIVCIDEAWGFPPETASSPSSGHHFVEEELSGLLSTQDRFLKRHKVKDVIQTGQTPNTG